MTECSAHIRSILTRRIDTLEKLDAVVALRRASDWTLSIPQLATFLCLPREVVRTLVIQLRATGMLELLRDGRARLLALDHDDGRAFDALLELYERDRLPVAIALAEMTLARIRATSSATVDSLERDQSDGERSHRVRRPREP